MYRQKRVTGMFFNVVSVGRLNTIPLLPLQTWIEGPYSPLTILYFMFTTLGSAA